jgi:hypothetical protein
MRFRWPTDTVFHREVVDVEQDACPQCGQPLHICDHRIHRIFTLKGPVELVCRLAHCSDPSCPARGQTHSPAAEYTFTLPRWLIGWDVFCWMGHRRFARHWSVSQLQAELRESYRIPLSFDAVLAYLGRYQTMLAARQQDPQQLASAYAKVGSLVLSIDGVQPEKGHETLYTVREWNAKRVWFAESLLSSGQDEVRRLLVRARQWASRLGKPVRLWLSDKQDAFVKGIALEFPDTPHRYCDNHFLRDLAKPTLEVDSTAKVQMRKSSTAPYPGLFPTASIQVVTCRRLMIPPAAKRLVNATTSGISYSSRASSPKPSMVRDNGSLFRCPAAYRRSPGPGSPGRWSSCLRPVPSS